MLEMGNFSNEFFKGTVADEKALEFGKILQEIYIELGGVVVANHEIFNSFKFWFAVRITDFFKLKKNNHRMPFKILHSMLCFQLTLYNF